MTVITRKGKVICILGKSCGDDGTTIRSMDVNTEDFDIKEMMNLIAKPLRTGELAYRKSVQPSMRRGNMGVMMGVH